ncbi:nucleotidyltransferase domain-containing protein [Dehalococcoidia bacterium]|nr:nucleotidyltransferase domain-containing protein [Dehalococcoidia bacterium]MCL0060009.1 nucleotidyltransferase domain-containing protein [Dehalococcoidia bacterium]MCL0103890.1 nucleotidyltransferase domain-containing protein [Dehalococcoidia bacterium]
MVTEEQIDEVKRRIAEDFKPQKIILFGSYANGTPTEDSDLDLLIIKDSDLPTRIQNRKVRKILTGLKIPVDVIVKTAEEFETYKDIIGTIIYPANKFGKVIYESR